MNLISTISYSTYDRTMRALCQDQYPWPAGTKVAVSGTSGAVTGGCVCDGSDNSYASLVSTIIIISKPSF